MSDVVAKPKSNHKLPGSVVERRVRTSDCKMTTIRTVDAASPTFGKDKLYVFRKNVAVARRENKKVTGVSDGVPAKR